jgi:hypothetical protein
MVIYGFSGQGPQISIVGLRRLENCSKKFAFLIPRLVGVLILGFSLSFGQKDPPTLPLPGQSSDGFLSGKLKLGSAGVAPLSASPLRSVCGAFVRGYAQ